MRLHRVLIRPRSPWRTPWQADTLMGLLCVTAVRTRGAPALRRDLIEPMLAGAPPFVLSDAFPGDWLPVPTILRTIEPSPVPDPKTFKRARWLTHAAFQEARRGHVPTPDSFYPDPFVAHQRRHNTLGRDNDSSLEEGGLFSRDEWAWQESIDPANGTLTLYARFRDDDALDLFLDLFHELSLVGYGADVATGRGQFELIDAPIPSPELDDPPPGANGLIVLSTFQPAPGDPTDGFWETFPRFGKLGPDLGLTNDEVHKHTLILCRPGACFRTSSFRPFLGRALPMDLILPAEIAVRLRGRGVEIVHPAYGLAIPACLWGPDQT